MSLFADSSCLVASSNPRYCLTFWLYGKIVLQVTIILYVRGLTTTKKCKRSPHFPGSGGMMTSIDEAARLERIASVMFSHAKALPKRKLLERFKSMLGVTPAIAAVVWIRLPLLERRGQRRLHFLWALLRLKVYATDEVCANIAQVDPKTFRKWPWHFIRMMARMKTVSCS